MEQDSSTALQHYSDVQHSYRQLKRTAVPSLFHYKNFNRDPEDNLTMSHAQDNHSPGCNVQSMKREKGDEQHINETKVEIEFGRLIICRTCLKETAAAIPLTNDDDDGCTLGAMLEKIADVRMEPGLPDVVCVTCAEDLRKAIAFSRRARLADNALRQKTQWRVFGDSTDTFSSLKLKQEPFASTSQDQTSEIEEKVFAYKYLQQNTVHTGNNEGKTITHNNDLHISSQKGRPNELQKKTYSNKKKVPQTKPILNETLKSEPMFVDVTKKEIKLKPVQLQDVLKALGPNILPLHIKKIQQNKLNNKLKISHTSTNQQHTKQEMPESKQLTTDSEQLTPDSEQVTPDSELLTTDSELLTTDLEQLTNDSEQLTPDGFDGPDGIDLMEPSGIDLMEPSGNTNKCPNTESTDEQTIPNELECHYIDVPIHPPMCPYKHCSIVLQTNRQVELHISEYHSSTNKQTIRVYECTICYRTYKSKYLAFKHMKTHKYKLIKYKRRYLCEECGKTFFYQNQLETHIRSKHTGEKPFKCDVCVKSFCSKVHLKRHSITHAPDHLRPYTCTRCDKGFLRKRQLANHMRSHSDVHRFQCKECGKMFSLKHNLFAHEKRVHGIFKCHELAPSSTSS